MKVIFLPNNTASLASSRIPKLREKNIEAVGFNLAPTTTQTKSEIICIPELKLGAFWDLLKFVCSLAYHLLTADVVHWIYGSKSKVATIILYSVALLKRKKFIEYCGSDVRSLEKLCSDAGYRLESFSEVSKEQLGTQNSSLNTQKKFADLNFFALPNSPELSDYMEPSINPQFEEIFRTVDLSKLQYVGTDPSKKKPLIVHMPSNPLIKGTDHFIAATKRLQDEGLIEMKLITGMPHHEALKVLQSADIVVDQLLIGEYGVLTIEAMALGKPVVCYLRPKLWNHYTKLEHFPVQNSNGHDLEQVLRSLVSDPAKRTRLGELGRKYVELYHNSEALTDQLISLYSRS